ncbi:hypothetical protein HS088_TW03G00469 [Tripterygium wilfordii]|uniref:Uncharacterized protein n=1 Tax=Tripterygium wilfordii TaxID=458696 RepID=A0A7J7DUZ1_TRIWF|nr:uncharacterized protein LOC119984509 [Tripterygium wilfordii]XP_038684437.1 uncharacterized protein LOC119984509 [Tripterygium wilfordii]KAF5750137.1 hypothetical protein HS088_TW03G00469 [Tripterygium wilfordii]
MNHFSLQQSAMTACEETRNLVLISDHRGPVFCPKPRRVGVLANKLSRPLRPHISHHAEVYDSRAGADILDLIIPKDSFVLDQPDNQVTSSPPPFFCGSPPSRAANPLIQDALFGEDKLGPISTLQVPSPSGPSSPSSAARKGGCARMTFGLKPAAVRVEGFDSHGRDRQNSRISAMA